MVRSMWQTRMSVVKRLALGALMAATVATGTLSGFAAQPASAQTADSILANARQRTLWYKTYLERTAPNTFLIPRDLGCNADAVARGYKYGRTQVVRTSSSWILRLLGYISVEVQCVGYKDAPYYPVVR